MLLVSGGGGGVRLDLSSSLSPHSMPGRPRLSKSGAARNSLTSAPAVAARRRISPALGRFEKMSATRRSRHGKIQKTSFQNRNYEEKKRVLLSKPASLVKLLPTTSQKATSSCLLSNASVLPGRLLRPGSLGRDRCGSWSEAQLLRDLQGSDKRNFWDIDKTKNSNCWDTRHDTNFISWIERTSEHCQQKSTTMSHSKLTYLRPTVRIHPTQPTVMSRFVFKDNDNPIATEIDCGYTYNNSKRIMQTMIQYYCTAESHAVICPYLGTNHPERRDAGYPLTEQLAGHLALQNCSEMSS